MTKWTIEQRAAIEAPDENLLLAAAAGSGKTTVLVERVATLLQRGADVREMLVVTFTRPAAADMRAALIRRLNTLALQDARYRQQAEYAEFASISTIHSFCTDLLRAHFQTANVDPAFRIADDAEANILRAKALEAAMNEAYARDDGDHRALTYGRTPDEVRELTLRLHGFIMERPDPWGWLDETIAALERGEDRFTPVLCEAANRLLRDARSIAEYLYRFCLDREKLEPFVRVCEADLELIESIEQMDYAAMRAALAKPAFVKKPGVRGLKDDPDNALFDRLRKQYKGLLDKAAERLPLELTGALADLPECAKELRGLRQLVRLLDAEYERLKDERSLLTFSDLERRALNALKNEDVQEAVRTRYRYVFVDEYQDVSDVQEALLTLAARPDSLFTVGDVKQSIYRFRHAEPTLFMRKYAAYREGDGGRLIVLNRNFRSRKTVLNFTNRVFERAMQGGDSEIVYDDAAKLYPGTSFEGGDPPVEVHLIDRGAAEEETPSNEAAALIAEMKEAETEALLAARRIRELRGTPVWDGKQGAYRPLQWRDFVILTRQARDVAQQMLNVLRREGVPAYADVSGGYLDVMEVQVALALLRLVENRRQDPEWIAVLRSPCMNLSSAELARIRTRFPEDSYADAVRAYAELNEDTLSDRLRALCDRLDRWRALSSSLPLSELVWTILSQSGLYPALGALPGGGQRQANLDALCDRAAGYERVHAGGLTGFLAYVQDMTGAREDMGEAHVLGENDDVVRIMTIHKSKGLEFPVVIGVLLGKRPGGGRRGGLIAHRSVGVGMKHMDEALGVCRDTLPRLAAEALSERESNAEELRILYVLMTRAKDRLMLIGSVKSAEAALDRWRMSRSRPISPENYLDLLMPPIGDLPGGEELRDGERIEDDSLPAVELYIHSKSALIAAEEEAAADGEALMDAAAEKAPDARWLDALTWRYPHEGAVLLPLKLTASGLSRELIGPAQPPELIPRPSFLSETGEMTGAERGTATHAALQELNLEALRGLDEEALHRAIVLQLNRLTEEGQLSAAQRAVVQPRTLVRFLSGELGRRMLASPRMHREWMFTLKMSVKEALDVESDESLLVQGSVDCCFEEDGGWVLLDYKTDRANDVDSLIARYRPQLTLYARALERITGTPVRETWLCLLSAGEAHML